MAQSVFTKVDRVQDRSNLRAGIDKTGCPGTLWELQNEHRKPHFSSKQAVPPVLMAFFSSQREVTAFVSLRKSRGKDGVGGKPTADLKNETNISVSTPIPLNSLVTVHGIIGGPPFFAAKKHPGPKNETISTRRSLPART